MRLLGEAGTPLPGAHAVVIGRSALVGKPVAALLIAQNATVTLCHSHTRDLRSLVRSADIVIAAVGKPGLVVGDWIKPGATVIDVGINRLPDGRLVGDVDFEGARQRAAAITPVPGGVGPPDHRHAAAQHAGGCDGDLDDGSHPLHSALHRHLLVRRGDRDAPTY